ncbi:diguanylate cyclase domain-containing protein [Vibrio gallaecicus]|uniref:sensor domain-containing diguanylate cyclase n=1 Tax=Vibrio gallaecicus TaxID=552386 RepID=UPI0010C94120|nr:diguanylate cyclase [Vibrio gallaecicus]MDN3617064.1 diguanylate cyclase [Vibrio gallaecicus]
MLSSMKNLSIKNKLFLPIILFISATFITIQWVSYTVTYERERDNLVQRVKVLAKGVAFNLQAAILFDDKESANEILSAFSADRDIVRVKLFDTEPQLFAMYQQQDRIPPVPNEQQRIEIRQKQFSISDQYIFLLVPVVLEQEVIAHLRVTISKQSFENIFLITLKTAGIYLILLLVLGTILYKIIQRFIIEPLFNLNEGMQAFVERRERTKKITLNSNDEIGDLVHAFNTMLERLGQREKQVNFTLDKLEQEKSFANEVIETVQHSLIVVNEDGEIIHSNAATMEIFRCTSAYLEGLTIKELIVTKQSDLLQSAIDSNLVLNDQLIESIDVFSSKQLLQVSSRELSKQGQTLFAIQDVTEIESAMNRQKLAAGVFENSQDGLVVLNASNEITMVNPAVTTLLGYEASVLLGKSPFEVLPWQQFTSLMPTIIESLENYGQWQGEVWEKHSSGNLVPMFVKINRIVSNQQRGEFDMVLTLSDLSNVKEMERLEHLAHHDALTGLANRSHLYKTLDEVVSSSQYSDNHFAVLYLDLDGFKEVNDTYGHDAGDEMLRQVASRLLSQVRSGDLVARLSGDEFVLIIKSTNKEMMSALAERLLIIITEEVMYKGRSLKVGASIGINLVEDDERDLDLILKAADQAMYQAKSKGKGCFVYSQ